MPSKSPNRSVNGGIDKLDFDANRKKPASSLHDSEHSGPSGLLRDDESLLSDVVEGVIERDRRRMKRAVTKYLSFACAILNCLCAGSITAYSLYAPLFQTRLRYTQFQVNAVSITAELAMYLPVPLFGYLCDRYNPRILSALAGIFFGAGYLLAALTYNTNDHKNLKSWPFGTMILAFVGIGMGTSCMYLSAVTTCAKNFGRGSHKGLALAMPIAAFGLSGMWQSQVGSQLLYDRERGDIDVFRFFVFLSGLLFGVGLLGAIALKVVDEEELIDEAVSELERSGMLENSPFFQRSLLHDSTLNHNNTSYGTLTPPPSDPPTETASLVSADPSESSANRRKKSWLLNTETQLFLLDPTMWLLAAGFFLVTGPGEAFINNLGTILSTLYPPPSSGPPPSNSPATHVSIVAMTSTLARLATGTLSDLLAPTSDSHEQYQPRRSVSRLTFLLTSTFLLSLSQIILASGLVQSHPSLFGLISSLQGLGYGAVFSLTPIVVSVVWGVENFGTNWGVVAVMPAGGAAVWGAVYSLVYQMGIEERKASVARETRCFGVRCYAGTFWAMAVCSWIAIGLWALAWRRWRRRGIAV